MLTYPELAEALLWFTSCDFGSGASEAEIQRAESALAVPIRGTYRAFLRQFGWGGVEHFELHGVGADVPPHLDLVPVTRELRADRVVRLPEPLLPILSDGAGSQYCLHTRAQGEPPVVYWDRAKGAEQLPELEAPDFAFWLQEELETLEAWYTGIRRARSPGDGSGPVPGQLGHA